MKNMTGGKLPAFIWKDFMTGAMRLASEGLGIVIGEVRADADTRPQCNDRACAKAYRSFRASDCSYQPYRGPRIICDK